MPGVDWGSTAHDSAPHARPRPLIFNKHSMVSPTHPGERLVVSADLISRPTFVKVQFLPGVR